MIQFEQLVHEMEPTIEKLLNKCGIYKNRDEYKQVALIALWKASTSYDPTKYHFKAYLYNQMRYDIIDALRQNVKKEQRYMPTTDDEKQLVRQVFVEQRSNEELAQNYRISVEGIRKRKYRLCTKLKALGKQYL